jgi:hypothetical protein
LATHLDLGLLRIVCSGVVLHYSNRLAVLYNKYLWKVAYCTFALCRPPKFHTMITAGYAGPAADRRGLRP